jgi:LacI family transcriptional regulator
MNFHLQILSVPKTIEDEIAMIEDFIGRGLQGLVVYARAGHGQLELLNSLVARRFPTVMIDRYYPNLDLDRVVFDDFEACYQLTAMLLAKGHRRIAVLPLDEIETTSVRDRLAGYRAALRDAGAAHDESLVWLDFYRDMVPPGAPPFPTHAEFVRRITRGHPTAVLALSGEAARRLAQVLLSVARPEEELGTRLEVVAVSHEAPSVFSPYPLTVALQDGEKLGAEAAKLLIERIRDGYDAPRKAIEVNMPIVTAA